MNHGRNPRDFTSEFVINNLPEEQREHLLLKDVRKSICEKADVSIAVRGRVVQPKSDGTLVCDGDEKPLYLLITAKSKHQLTRAMQEIQSILASSVDSHREERGSSGDVSLEEKITVGIDIWPAQFCMKSRILGENGEFVEYIEKETGAMITLRGKGSNYGDDNKYDEPLHVYIKYENSRMKEKTRELVLNLIETVQRDFLDLYAKYYAKPKKPEIIPVRIRDVQAPSNQNSMVRKVSEKSDLQSRNDTDKITVGFDYAPRNFDLKAKIYGPNYAHTEHIEKEGGALILLQGRGCRFPEKDDVDEPPHLLVKYQNLQLKSKARELIFNLLENVQEEYVRLHGTAPVKPAKPRIVLYDPKLPQTRRISCERSVSPGRNPEYLKRVNTSLQPRFQNASLPLGRSNTPPSSKRPSTPKSRRPNTPPMSRHRDPSPLSSRNLNSSPPVSRRSNTPPKSSRFPKTPSSSFRQPNTLPSSMRRPHSPSTLKRPHSPPSRYPHSPPTSKRPNTPPQSSRHSTSHQYRSLSPVNAPPPPIISSSEPCNPYNSAADLLPPIIPPLNNCSPTKPLPSSSFPLNDFSKPRKNIGIADTHHQWKTSQMDLPEPVQDFKSPEFYMVQAKQPLQFVAPSFKTQSDFGQPKYVKKRKNSPDSSANNAFTKGKKHCPPFSSVADAKMDHKRDVESASTAPHKQMNKTNSRVRHRSLVHISFKEEFAVPQEFSKIQNTSTSCAPAAQFNGYDYQTEDTHKFAIPTSTSIAPRKLQDKQMQKSFSMSNDNYYSSDSDDAASVICLDSEDDHYHLENPSSSRRQAEKPISCPAPNNKPMTFSVKVQTENEDEVLKNKKLQCVCGKFTHYLTGVRSRAVQTEPERYCRY